MAVKRSAVVQSHVVYVRNCRTWVGMLMLLLCDYDVRASFEWGVRNFMHGESMHRVSVFGIRLRQAGWLGGHPSQNQTIRN